MTLAIDWPAIAAMATYRKWTDEPGMWCWPDLAGWVARLSDRFWFGPPFPPAPYDRPEVMAAVYIGRAIGCWGARVPYPFATRSHP